MTLVIDIAPEMEGRLRDQAAREGLAPERYVLQTAAERLDRVSNGNTPHLPRAELELLQRINEGLPAEIWEQYHDIVAERRAGTLTPERHKTLAALSEQVGVDYAQRLDGVLQLARLRGTSLEAQMQALGIPQHSYD